MRIKPFLPLIIMLLFSIVSGIALVPVVEAADEYHPYDKDQNREIEDFELLDAIDAWALGKLEDFALLNLIDFWAAGCYKWDTSDEKFKPGCSTEPQISGLIPKVVWTFEPGVKTPVTDLAGCVASVLNCVSDGTALKECFGTKVAVCSGEVPSGGCCMQACAEQITERINSGKSEQDAYLEVLVNDGSCMPNIETGKY